MRAVHVKVRVYAPAFHLEDLVKDVVTYRVIRGRANKAAEEEPSHRHREDGGPNEHFGRCSSWGPESGAGRYG